MSDERIFCGSGKEIETQYGKLMKLSFTEADLKALQDNMENGWVNAAVKAIKEPKEGKPTHYLQVDTWKPNGDSMPKPTDDDLPF